MGDKWLNGLIIVSYDLKIVTKCPHSEGYLSILGCLSLLSLLSFSGYLGLLGSLMAGTAVLWSCRAAAERFIGLLEFIALIGLQQYMPAYCIFFRIDNTYYHSYNSHTIASRSEVL